MSQENATASYPLKSSAPSFQAGLSVENQVLRLINRDFFASTSSVKELHKWLDEQRKYKSIGRVVGPHGVGKSVGLDTYKNPRGNGRLRSLPLYALYIEIFPGWSIRDICVRILTLLNHGDRRGKSKNLLLRTWEALIEFGVETLIVDHADEVTRKALISMIRLSLRKETRISLILAGSTELESRLIKEDLDSFFESCHDFSALSYVDFANVLLDEFAGKFLGLSDSSSLFDQEVLKQLFKASRMGDTEWCNFRRLMNILVKAITESSENQPSWCINKAVLQNVVEGDGKSKRTLPEFPGEIENDAV